MQQMKIRLRSTLELLAIKSNSTYPNPCQNKAASIENSGTSAVHCQHKGFFNRFLMNIKIVPGNVLLDVNNASFLSRETLRWLPHVRDHLGDDIV